MSLTINSDYWVLMRVEERKLTNGKSYFSFVYWNGSRRVRLKKNEHPAFDSKAKAEEWAKSKEAEIETTKGRILRKLQWKTQYYEFSKLADDYTEYCKKKQPNSWKNSQANLQQYVFPFFLNIKSINNVNNWPMYFEDFRKWLEDEAVTIKRGQKKLEYSTKNHCIQTLNTFLEFLVKSNLADPASIYKMSGFSSSKCNSRDANALISCDEFKTIHQNLKDQNELIAAVYETAYWTGMRFNEICGLSLDDLFMGDLEDVVLRRALDDHDIKYYGYLVLESQPVSKSKIRLDSGVVERKPLKGKPKIDEKHNRIIPIISKELFNNLVKFYKEQEKLFGLRKFGLNRKDYLLFDGVSQTKAFSELKRAYLKTTYAHKCYHCCRHTRCTELVGQTRDFVLAKFWLGHSRQETTMRYTHIYQQSVRVARKKIQTIDFI